VGIYFSLNILSGHFFYMILLLTMVLYLGFTNDITIYLILLK